MLMDTIFRHYAYGHSALKRANKVVLNMSVKNSVALNRVNLTALNKILSEDCREGSGSVVECLT